MSVTLTLSPETEKKLSELAAGAGQSLAQYLEQLAERAASTTNGSPTEVTPAERAAQWRAWAASHRKLPYVADDSRESIYEGRGE